MGPDARARKDPQKLAKTTLTCTYERVCIWQGVQSEVLNLCKETWFYLPPSVVWFTDALLCPPLLSVLLLL